MAKNLTLAVVFKKPGSVTVLNSSGTSDDLNCKDMMTSNKYLSMGRLLFAAIMISHVMCVGPPWTEGSKLTPSGLVGSDFYGEAVSVYKNVALIGKRTDNSNAGAAFAFKSPDGGTNWNQPVKLVPATALANDAAGTSVCIYEFFAYLGAPSVDNSGDSNVGAVFRFQSSDAGSSWSELSVLVPSTRSAGEKFGSAISANDKLALIRAEYCNSDGVPGVAYIFKSSDGGSTWSQTSKLSTGSSGSNCFGNAVSLYENDAVIGARAETVSWNNAGAAYIFQSPDGGPSWNKTKRLTALKTMNLVSQYPYLATLCSLERPVRMVLTPKLESCTSS